jgi:hypothetical protein
MSTSEIIGYLHVFVESIEADNIKEPIHAHITFG